MESSNQLKSLRYQEGRRPTNSRTHDIRIFAWIFCLPNGDIRWLHAKLCGFHLPSVFCRYGSQSPPIATANSPYECVKRSAPRVLLVRHPNLCTLLCSDHARHRAMSSYDKIFPHHATCTSISELKWGMWPKGKCRLEKVLRRRERIAKARENWCVITRIPGLFMFCRGLNLCCSCEQPMSGWSSALSEIVLSNLKLRRKLRKNSANYKVLGIIMQSSLSKPWKTMENSRLKAHMAFACAVLGMSFHFSCRRVPKGFFGPCASRRLLRPQL